MARTADANAGRVLNGAGDCLRCNREAFCDAAIGPVTRRGRERGARTRTEHPARTHRRELEQRSTHARRANPDVCTTIPSSHIPRASGFLSRISSFPSSAGGPRVGPRRCPVLPSMHPAMSELAAMEVDSTGQNQRHERKKNVGTLTSRTYLSAATCGQTMSCGTSLGVY